MITTKAPAIKSMNKAEATAITERIRKHIDAAWADITRAYEGKAWKPLGYASWEAYVRAEFDMSRRRSYQLIDQGRVIQAIADATGENVQRVAQISARDVAAVKDKLPEVKEEIASRVSNGQAPTEAVASTIAAAKMAKQPSEKGAEKAANDAFRAAARAALPASIQAAEAAKATAKKTTPRDAELEQARETIAALESDVAKLRDENKRYEEMRVQFEKGGFEEVIRGKDEQIRVLLTRVESESQEKVRNLRTLEYWKAEAIKLGWSDREVIDLKAGEVANG